MPPALRSVRWRLVAAWALGAWLIIRGDGLLPRAARACNPFAPSSCEPVDDPCLTYQEGRWHTCQGWAEIVACRTVR